MHIYLSFLTRMMIRTTHSRTPGKEHGYRFQIINKFKMDNNSLLNQNSSVDTHKHEVRSSGSRKSFRPSESTRNDGTLKDVIWNEKVYNDNMSPNNIDNYDYCMVFKAETDSKG